MDVNAPPVHSSCRATLLHVREINCLSFIFNQLLLCDAATAQWENTQSRLLKPQISFKLLQLWLHFESFPLCFSPFLVFPEFPLCVCVGTAPLSWLPPPAHLKPPPLICSSAALYLPRLSNRCSPDRYRDCSGRERLRPILVGQPVFLCVQHHRSPASSSACLLACCFHYQHPPALNPVLTSSSSRWIPIPCHL